MLYLGEWATNLTYTPRLYHENSQGPIVVSLPGRYFFKCLQNQSTCELGLLLAYYEDATLAHAVVQCCRWCSNWSSDHTTREKISERTLLMLISLPKNPSIYFVQSIVVLRFCGVIGELIWAMLTILPDFSCHVVKLCHSQIL